MTTHPIHPAAHYKTITMVQLLGYVDRILTDRLQGNPWWAEDVLHARRVRTELRRRRKTMRGSGVTSGRTRGVGKYQ